MYRNPYQLPEGGRWYKVNFHTHAGTGPDTCGANPTDMVVSAYKQAGFDMLCISNHDLFTETSDFSDEHILMIPGVEYSRKPHMLTVGIHESLHERDHQQAIDETSRAKGFTILCHPNWTMTKHWRPDEIAKMSGYLGIEVINMLIYRLGGSGLATDIWDGILSSGKLAYGFGNDDFHIFADAGRSYNYIYCVEKSIKGMIDAVRSGRFCASTGLMPDHLVIEDGVIRVRVKFPKDTFIDTFTYRFTGEGGKVLSVQEGEEAQHRLTGEKYVRIEAIGENGALLFFQPIWLEGALSPA